MGGAARAWLSRERRYRLLCFMLVGWGFLLRPLRINEDSVLTSLIYASLVALSLSCVAGRGPARTIAMVAGVVTLVADWIGLVAPSSNVRIAEFLAGGILMTAVTVRIVSHVARTRVVDLDMLFGAADAFLLLGLVWGMAYAVVEVLAPGSLVVPGGAGLTTHEFLFSLNYFSFVTMTTLGYGDVLPVSAFARSLAVLEALSGQFFMAVLVGRLVGLHLASAGRDS